MLIHKFILPDIYIRIFGAQEQQAALKIEIHKTLYSMSVVMYRRQARQL